MIHEALKKRKKYKNHWFCLVKVMVLGNEGRKTMQKTQQQKPYTSAVWLSTRLKNSKNNAAKTGPEKADLSAVWHFEKV